MNPQPKDWSTFKQSLISFGVGMAIYVATAVLQFLLDWFQGVPVEAMAGVGGAARHIIKWKLNIHA